MRWTFLGLAMCAFASLWGVGSVYALGAAFIVLFANFATFCILYDRPKERARRRIAGQLRQLHPQADVAQRMATAPITLTVADRHLGFGPLTILNLATGIVAAVFVIWGVVLRMS